jgi:hypothetical protein
MLIYIDAEILADKNQNKGEHYAHRGTAYRKIDKF